MFGEIEDFVKNMSGCWKCTCEVGSNARAYGECKVEAYTHGNLSHRVSIRDEEQRPRDKCGKERRTASGEEGTEAVGGGDCGCWLRVENLVSWGPEVAAEGL